MMSAVMPWLGDFASDLTCAEVPAVIGETPVMACCLQAAGVMDEERKLKAFISRHKLKKLRSWGKRGTQLDAQLGNHHEPAAMGEPTLCSEARGINGKKPSALRAHWSNAVRADGARKRRSCAGGPKRAAPWLCQLAAQMCVPYIKQPCM